MTTPSTLTALCFNASQNDGAYPKLTRHVLNVDSRDRENYAGTRPNDFRVKFETYNNVVGMNLIQAQIPNTEYVINDRNNKIDFVDSVAGTVVATLTKGNYTATELANEINLQMNAAVGAGLGVEYTVTYITFTQKFRIENLAANTFQILWNSGANAANAFWYEFGDLSQTDTAAGLSAYNSTGTVRLSGDDYINMILDSGQSFQAQDNTSRTQSLFAKIILAAPPRSVIFQDQQGSNPLIFSPPITQLSSLLVKFRHPRQAHRTAFEAEEPLYDFNGHDLSFSIEILTAD